MDPQSLELSAALYGHAVVEVVQVTTPEVAAAYKILENTYRAVNIALVNELKVLYDRMASTSGRSSGRPRPNRSVSRHFIRAPAWADTASRSTRST
jgi:UDP-glucose 6-dehydrogenase